jgi:hypothetical protein
LCFCLLEDSASDGAVSCRINRWSTGVPSNLRYSGFDSALYRNVDAKGHFSQENATSHDLQVAALESKPLLLRLEPAENAKAHTIPPAPAAYRSGKLILSSYYPHPSHKNKDVARMGHPNIVGIYLPNQ